MKFEDFIIWLVRDFLHALRSGRTASRQAYLRFNSEEFLEKCVPDNGVFYGEEGRCLIYQANFLKMADTLLPVGSISPAGIGMINDALSLRNYATGTSSFPNIYILRSLLPLERYRKILSSFSLEEVVSGRDIHISSSMVSNYGYMAPISAAKCSFSELFFEIAMTALRNFPRDIEVHLLGTSVFKNYRLHDYLNNESRNFLNYLRFDKARTLEEEEFSEFFKLDSDEICRLSIFDFFVLLCQSSLFQEFFQLLWMCFNRYPRSTEILGLRLGNFSGLFKYLPLLKEIGV